MKLKRVFANLITTLSIVAFLIFLCTGCGTISRMFEKDKSGCSMNKGYAGEGGEHPAGMRK